MIRHILLFFLCVIIILKTEAQTLTGQIIDETNLPLIGINVFLVHNQQIGTTTSLDGKFELVIPHGNLNDTLEISFVGYRTQKIALKIINYREPLKCQLDLDDNMLAAIEIKVKNPIAEEFSVRKLDKMAVYINPIAAADPLKAITALPASTNTEETANPSLRGSDPDRTRIVFNDVPVYRPVRNTELNGVGYFSLFNTELINEMLVYASNPPLTYGNSSGGLVQIETLNRLEENTLNISLSLANAGFFTSRKLKNEKNFIQAYGNYQFSDGFLAVNEQNYDFLKKFQTIDGGLNFHSKLSRRWTFNLFSYGIKEQNNVDTQMFTYQGTAEASGMRNFNILNLKYTTDKFYLSLSNGTNFSETAYTFGNIDADNSEKNTYTSLNAKYYLSNDFMIQGGVTHEYVNYHYNQKLPVFYYAMAPESPQYTQDTLMENHNAEGYLYAKLNLNKWVLGAGVRKNMVIDDQTDYTSFQGSVKYNIHDNHSLLFSLGQYYSYSLPNSLNVAIHQLGSKQMALEYNFEMPTTRMQIAAFAKEDEAPQVFPNPNIVEKKHIKGMEFFWEQRFLKKFTLSAANTFLDVEHESSDIRYKGYNSLEYFIKSSLSYQHSTLGNFALTLLTRPGTFYTPVNSAAYNNFAGAFEPVFAETLNSAQYNNYTLLSFAYNKYVKFQKFSMVYYFSVANILNQDNQRTIWYNQDYSANTFNRYQKRTLYFGTVIGF